jgi:probable F420-dependent oxidoreductase
VYLAAVGELMTEVAGEVADGLLVHPFSTERYIREVTLPALERGLAKSGRNAEDFPISFSGLVATGETEAELADATKRVRGQIAFYGSTPAYRGVLDLHGWGDLQGELNTLSKTGEWEKMGELIDDDVLNAFSVVAAPTDVGAVVRERLDDVISRFGIYAPYALSDSARRTIVNGLRF